MSANLVIRSRAYSPELNRAASAIEQAAWSNLGYLNYTRAHYEYYAELLDAIGDSKHERHAEFKEWIADDFDPNIVDAKWLAEEVAALAKRWSRKPAPRRARRA